MKLANREYGTGQPMIILHGLFGQSDNWNTLAKQFAEKGFRVFTVDQRNHGLSPHSTEWDYEWMAKDLKEFIEEHQLQQPILMGHSMGGKTVMFFEHLFPGIASRLIIADMAARSYPAHHNDVIMALQAVDFNLVRNRKDAENKLGEFLNDFGTKQFLLKNIYWKDTTGNIMDWRFNLNVIVEKYNSIGVGVPEFTSPIPTLVIRGERSDYVEQSDLEDFKKRFAHLTVETIAGAGHWVHAEKPKEYFEAVMKFLHL